jgi:hypothetical protein
MANATERVVHLDTIIAVCALLVSTITAGAMVYQTRVLQDQFSATVWPYLSVSMNYTPEYVQVRLINEGVGPALIRSAQVVVDGKPLGRWDSVLSAIFKQRVHATHIELTSVDSSTAIRAGEELTLLRIDTHSNAVGQILKHNMTLKFCYCSINSRCWNLVSSTQSAHASIPVMARTCNESSIITAPVSRL